MFSHFGEILNKPVDKKPIKKEKCSTKAKEMIDNALIQQAIVSEAVALKEKEKAIPKLEKIRMEIQKIHETVSTVQSLLPLLKDGNDGQSLIKQLQDANDRFQHLIPLMNDFMSELPPDDEVDMEVWKLERENLCREFENTITNFRTVQKDVMEALKGIKQVK